VPGSEPANLRPGVLKVEPGQEDRRAQDLGEPGRFVLDEVAGRRHPNGVEFMLLSPRYQALAQRQFLAGRRRRDPAVVGAAGEQRRQERDPKHARAHHSSSAGRCQIGDVQAISWIVSG